MSNTIKIQVGFKFQQHTVQIVTEVQPTENATAIADAAQKLLGFCKQVVSQNGNGTPPAPPTATNGNGTIEVRNPSHPASEKQVKAIWGIAKGQGMEESAIKGLPSRFSKGRLDDLTKGEASQLIQELKAAA